MSVTLVVNSIPFEYPDNGTPPGWGEAATDWAVEVTEVLGALLGPNDIIETTFNIQNDVSSFTNIASLVFNTSQVRAAFIKYVIYRTSDTNPSGNAEAGSITAVYDNSASAGSKWIWTVHGIAGNSGTIFNFTDLGQIQYKTTDIGAVGYSGTMSFSAESLES